MARTRFAPSPTGMLHIGGVRTALYCYALSHKTNGQFIVRIEDTDQKRFVEGAIEEIFDMLHEMGLDPDESLRHGGDYGSYLQSERKEIYQEYAQKLLDSGHAYYCFLEGEELQAEKEKQKGRGFRSPYRDMAMDEAKKLIADGKEYTIRLKVPNDRIIKYTDGLQGTIEFDSNIVGDEVMIKSNGMGSYHLAVVVDDYLMKITHVFRAAEWLPSTPKQVLIHEFLGLEMPPYYHLSVILDPAGGKLSKRNGSVSTRDFLKNGYLPEAMLNFLMLLGWSAPIDRKYGEKEREIFSLNEFIDLFDLKDLNKVNAIFDRQKILWFNKEYVKSITNYELREKYLYWLENFAEDKSSLEEYKNDSTLESKLELVKERAKTLLEIQNMIKFFYSAPSNLDWKIDQLKNVGDNLENVRKDILDLHSNLSDDSTKWTHEEWENGMRAVGDKYSIKHGDVFMVLRIAIVGEPFSPPLFEALQILGKEETINRLNK